jgi:hypothetical protein
MTWNEFVTEVEFIHARVLWLRRQPQDADGKLLCRDYRDECGMLQRRISELQEVAVTF